VGNNTHAEAVRAKRKISWVTGYGIVVTIGLGALIVSIVWVICCTPSSCWKHSFRRMSLPCS